MAARSFAEDTSVPVDRTHNDIEKVLVVHGAQRFAYGWERDGRVGITFIRCHP